MPDRRAVTASLTPWIASRMGWIAAFVFAAVLAVIGGAMWLLVHPGRQEGSQLSDKTTEFRAAAKTRTK